MDQSGLSPKSSGAESPMCDKEWFQMSRLEGKVRLMPLATRQVVRRKNWEDSLLVEKSRSKSL
jgi:hypothetical protein